MTSPPIAGLVALVEDEYTLVINRGANAGVMPGMTFAVLAEGSRRITDPETGHELGRLTEEKLRVKVFDVHPSFARAETFSTGVPQVPQAPILSGMTELARHAGGVLQDSALHTALSPGEIVAVSVGDQVELVAPEADPTDSRAGTTGRPRG